MSSVVSNSFKQTNGYFVTLAVLPSSNMYKAPVVRGTGGSHEVVAPVPYTSLATASLGAGVAGIVSGAGLPVNMLLKDMGKTVISSARTYRKVQPVVVSGPPMDGESNTFYIELATSTQAAALSSAAKVAYLPGLF